MTNILNCPQVTITVWGDFALFSRPEGKVERITYPVPTPSAVRGMLASIYSKPAEFYWQVQRIEVLKKIQYATFKRNELKSKMPRIPAGNPMKACLLIEEDRTQRQSVVLPGCALPHHGPDCAPAGLPRFCDSAVQSV